MNRNARAMLVGLSTLIAAAFAFADEAIAEREVFMPPMAELDKGWHTLKPGGETRCALGDEYKFFVHPGEAEKLMIHFLGGGLCWNAQLCHPALEDIYYKTVRADQDPAWMIENWGQATGIFDRSHADNPLADYTMVVVPYCTGDVHLGNRDVDYVLELGNGATQEFTVHHRGLVNGMAAIGWVRDNIGEPSTVFVGGTSAGALAVPYYARLLATAFPQARVTGLANDAGGARAKEMQGVDHRAWGVPEVLQNHETWQDLWADGVDMPDAFIRGGEGIKNLALYQLDHAHDLVQRSWIGMIGGQPVDLEALIRTNRQSIRDQLHGFRGFTVGGTNHIILISPLFYQYQTQGTRLRDWVAGILSGTDASDVDCTNCSRPAFRYVKGDLEIIDHALEQLAEPEAWNPDSTGPEDCPEWAEQFSLVCAVVQGIRATSRLPHDHHAAWWEVVHAAMEAHGQDPTWNAPVSYNNRSDATHEDMVALLRTVRERMVAAHQDNH